MPKMTKMLIEMWMGRPLFVLIILLCTLYSAEAGELNATEVMRANSWDEGVAIVTADGLYGTGWWISKDTIVTAAHVVEFKYKNVDVIKGDYHGRGSVVHLDEDRDVAIVRVQNPPEDAFVFRFAKKLKKTETIYVIGYPYELLQLQPDVEKLSDNPRCARGTISWIDPEHGIAEITAHTDSGNSGGPVVNEDGEVVGIVTFAMIGKASTLYFITVNSEVQEVLNSAGVPYKEEIGVSHETKQYLKYGLIGGFIAFLLVMPFIANRRGFK